jgi:hypothetical protein
LGWIVLTMAMNPKRLYEWQVKASHCPYGLQICINKSAEDPHKFAKAANLWVKSQKTIFGKLK